MSTEQQNQIRDNVGVSTKPDESTETALEILGDLNAGVFAQQLGRALSDVAMNVCTTGKKGEVAISLKFEQIGEGNQVAVRHKLTYTKPTMRGKASEETTTDTPLHVGPGGRLSLLPETRDLFGERKRRGV